MNLSIQSLSFGVFAIFIGVSQVSSANDVCRTLQKNLFYTAIRNTNQLRSQIRYDKVLADAYEKSNNVVLKDHIQTVEAISLGMNAGIEADRQDLREYIKFATACFPNLTSEDISDLLKPLSE